MAIAAVLLAASLALRHAPSPASGEPASPPPPRASARPVAEPPLLVTDPASGLTAVATVGARNVRILYLRGGSFARMQEVFVPAGEGVASLAWAGDGRGLVIATGRQRYALDTRTARLAALPPAPTELAAIARGMRRP